MTIRIDPRLYQIAVLRSLLSYGLMWLTFGVSGEEIALMLSSA